ncbi:PBSX family phage terminase large subunit [Apilactobacillus micheneri]|uniref:PBSX family phage terminase large subunit n=1 Tax=Apilactobacillus micheneri TaxID=1899430 RepID=A0ABY2YUY4_9LACO|nr:PBSX family phage terminase large subunit [Apilactobacillus micheneri]TPR23103.1 PBSX family phage terminase large subunit [Apilactobacillus micheneri]TPR24421.1 PBSX family phage terminase large subunit [Apilactobacillus micheneri]TPR29368.1 PBSX family phage terminase large subunit [Apilactobacillus micheneri]TPR34575.1 PBSX family phage terminase large subunit [Apilactobacillus micheneri]
MAFLTKKQSHVLYMYKNSPLMKLMILTGAVRSGKTFLDNIIFLLETLRIAKLAKKYHIKRPQYILAGADSNSIYSNIIVELYNTFGMTFKFDKHNNFYIKHPNLPPVLIKQAYTSSIAGLNSIRGITAYGAYINEASLANEQVFNEIRNRCSGQGARVICDTNPDVPTHFLKGFIDKAEESKYILSETFTLDDNEENLDPNYVKSLKETTPSGMLYDRYILGKWTSGQGVVYEDFDYQRDVISDDEFKNAVRGHTLEYYCGLDWGYKHKGTIVLLCDDVQTGVTYMIKDYTRTDGNIDYWTQIAREIKEKYGYNIPFYCDSARPEYVDALKDDQDNASYGYKPRLAGIEMVSKKMRTGKFKVLKSGDNYFTKELFKYEWDDKTGFPIKKDDDVMDATKYGVATKIYIKRNRPTQNVTNDNAKVALESGLI